MTWGRTIRTVNDFGVTFKWVAVCIVCTVLSFSGHVGCIVPGAGKCTGGKLVEVAVIET